MLVKGTDVGGGSTTKKTTTTTTSSKPSIVSSITNAIKNAVSSVTNKATSTPAKTTTTPAKTTTTNNTSNAINATSAGKSTATSYLGGAGTTLPTSNAYAAASQNTVSKTPTVSSSVTNALKNAATPTPTITAKPSTTPAVSALRPDFGTIEMTDTGVTINAGKDSPITKQANLQNSLLNPLGNTDVLKSASAVQALNSGVQAYDTEKLIEQANSFAQPNKTVVPSTSLTYDEILQNMKKYAGDDTTETLDLGDGYKGRTGIATEQATVEDSYWNELLDAFLKDNETQRDAAIQAILDNLGTVEKTYLDRIQEVIDQYDSLVDQNQVDKDKARRALRESQANRGNLDSGYGRQEQLDMNLGYDNKTAELKAAKTKAVNEIYNLIEQAKAEARQNQANVNATYDQAALNARLNSMA